MGNKTIDGKLSKKRTRNSTQRDRLNKGICNPNTAGNVKYHHQQHNNIDSYATILFLILAVIWSLPQVVLKYKTPYWFQTKQRFSHQNSRNLPAVCSHLYVRSFIFPRSKLGDTKFYQQNCLGSFKIEVKIYSKSGFS